MGFEHTTRSRTHTSTSQYTEQGRGDVQEEIWGIGRKGTDLGRSLLLVIVFWGFGERRARDLLV